MGKEAYIGCYVDLGSASGHEEGEGEYEEEEDEMKMRNIQCPDVGLYGKCRLKFSLLSTLHRSHKNRITDLFPIQLHLRRQWAVIAYPHRPHPSRSFPDQPITLHPTQKVGRVDPRLTRISRCKNHCFANPLDPIACTPSSSSKLHLPLKLPIL